MRWFRATALALIGAASLVVGTAAEGQNNFGGIRSGHAMSFGRGGFGHGDFGQGGVRHRGFGQMRFGRDWIGVTGRGHHFRHHPGGRHHRFGHSRQFGQFGQFGQFKQFERFERFGRSWPDGYGVGFGIGYGGYATGGYRDSDYFMAYSGPRAAARYGRVVYDYDRGYPYDYYSDDGPGGASVTAAARAPRCSTEWGWDSRERRDVPIRVCRQSGG